MVVLGCTWQLERKIPIEILHSTVTQSCRKKIASSKMAIRVIVCVCSIITIRLIRIRYGRKLDNAIFPTQEYHIEGVNLVLIPNAKESESDRGAEEGGR